MSHMGKSHLVIMWTVGPDDVAEGDRIFASPRRVRQRQQASFDRICRRLLQRDRQVPVALVVFDVLELDGEPTMRLAYRHRARAAGHRRGVRLSREAENPHAGRGSRPDLCWHRQ